MTACPITVSVPYGKRTEAAPCGAPVVTDLCAKHEADRERLAVPRVVPMLVTTHGGVVHHWNCRRTLNVTVWPWEPRNDGPGVARACGACLPEGLPVELVEVER